ncbi:hypothetical protein OGAPHI_001480 [Ogataea philodendri]|uniref:Exocyst complex component Sec6 n=1 Tax=Ogataea philodendri TaxID=1378263 RepID=A0A9P8PDN0_9ASCO|nr:uncharacterized protein OGAPHI_001480 [Ogataea philodendri]KAH3669359.1 hypothetical protein OGAPHI_001480 [Ogataea philodendri]
MAPDISVLAKVNDLLRDQDDLDRLPLLRDDLKKEKASIGSQLKIECDKRIANITSVLENLQLSSKDLKHLRDNLNKVESLRQQSISNIDKYELFDKSSVVYSNFEKVVATYTSFVQLEERLDVVDKLLDRELPENDYFPEDSPAEGLLLIHYELNGLRDLKDELTQLSESSRAGLRNVVMQSFSRLDHVIAKFDHMLRLIVDNFVSIIGCSNFGLIVKLVKILEFEEREDLRLQLMDHLISQSKSSEQSALNRLATYVKRTSPRNYKRLVYGFFRESIETSFDAIVQGSDPNEVLAIIEENYYEILVAYKVGAERGFPANWLFFNKVLGWYQNSLRKVVKKLLDDPTLPTSYIVRVLTFDYDNAQAIREKFGLTKKQVEPFALFTVDERQRLLNECLEFNVKKTREWVENAFVPALNLFASMDREPSDSSAEKLGIEMAQTLIEIFRSNVNTLLDAGDSPILLEYLQFFCVQVLRQFYDRWVVVLEQGAQRWTAAADAADNENVGWLPRYVTILANDCVRLMNGLELQFKEVEQMVHSNFHPQLQDILSQGSQHVLNLGTECLVKLNGFIVVEYEPYLQEVFTKRWYKSDEMVTTSLQIVDSYLVPLKEYLDAELFESLFELVYDTYLLHYLQALNTGNKIDTKKFESVIERDGHLINTQFSSYIDNTQIIEDHVYIFDILIYLVNFETEQDYTDAWPGYLEVFNDLPPDFLKAVLECKRMKDSKIRFIVDECTHISREFTRDNITPTFMSKFKV